MNGTPAKSLYADIGYWDALMCPTFPKRRCGEAREQLRQGLAATVGSGTAADRVMFGTDWFMIAQLKGWTRYPDKVLASLKAIGTSDAALEKIFRTNAEACFRNSERPAAGGARSRPAQNFSETPAEGERSDRYRPER